MIHEFVSSLSLILHRSGRRHLTTAPSKPHRGLAILIKSRKGKTDMKVQQSRSTVRKGEPNVHLHSAAVIALAAEQQEAQCSDLFTQLISCKNLLMQVPDESMQVATVSDSSTVFKQTARCKQFLSALLRMSREEHPESVTAIQSLIQDLVDTKLEPEEFTTKLQEEIDCSSSKTDLVLPLIQVSSIYLFIYLFFKLNAQCFEFIQENVSNLRQLLSTGDLTIDGIRPPRFLSPSPPAKMSIDLNQIPELHLIETSKGGPKKRKNVEKESGKKAKNATSSDDASPSSSRPIISIMNSNSMIESQGKKFSNLLPLSVSDREAQNQPTVTAMLHQPLDSLEHTSYSISNPSAQNQTPPNIYSNELQTDDVALFSSSSSSTVQQTEQSVVVFLNESSHLSVIHRINQVSSYFFISGFKLIWCHLIALIFLTEGDGIDEIVHLRELERSWYRPFP